MKKLNLPLKILIATVLGIVIGALFGDRLQFLQVVGDVFLRLVQMNIVLLVLGHVIEAVGNLNPKELGKLGAKTFSIFIISSLIASVWGVVTGLVFRPGAGMDASLAANSGAVEARVMDISQTILGFVPSNIVQSMAGGTVIHVILYGIIFGIAAGYVCSATGSRQMLELISTFNKTIIRIIAIVMTIAPVCICTIMITTVGRLGIGVIVPLAKYLGIYAVATVVYWILWQLIVCAVCKVRLGRLIRNMAGISLMAITTVSSAITLPTTLRDGQEKCGIGNKTAKLVLPLGMSLNCNGAAMHMAITVITIAQMYGIHFEMGQIVYLVILATLASMANAVAPGASVVSLSIMVPAMGLPLESIALFASVDYFVGMLRTILNVDADVFTAMLVGKSEGDWHADIFDGKIASAEYYRTVTS